MPANRLITRQQAAEFLGVTLRGLDKMIARGDLTGYRIRGMRAVRLNAADVEALLEVVPTVRGRAAAPPPRVPVSD